MPHEYGMGGSVKKYKKLLFIINPNAGIQRKDDCMEEIISVFDENDYETTVCYTKASGDAKRIVEEHVDDSVDLVVCMGGDGTLNETFSGVRSIAYDKPIGYIPAGSTNDFAAGLGIPSNPAQAARKIMQGRVKTLDLGCFNDRVFVYTACNGIFTRTSYETPQAVKNKIGHLAYILEGIKDMTQLHPIRMKLDTDAGVFEDEYIFVAICNTFSLGGIMSLDEGNVDLNDGYFELLTIANPRDILQLNAIVKILYEQSYNDETSLVRMIKISKAEIDFPEGDDWSLDGEKGQGQVRNTFKVIHNAVKLIY